MDKNQIEIEKGLNLIAKSSIFVFGAIMISKILTYAYRIIIARYYGPEVYGLFSLGIMIFGFFVAFASLGFAEGLIRFVPIYRANKEKEKIKYLIKFSNKILLFSGVISAVLLFSSAKFIAINIFHNTDLIFYLKLFSFLIPVNLFMGLYFSVLRSHERINANSFGINILQNFAKLIFIGFFIFISLSAVKAVSFSYSFGIFAGLIFAYLYCKIKLPYVFLKPNLSKEDKVIIRKNLFTYSWPLILFTIIGTLMMWLDTFFIGYFMDSYWVGIYNAAIPIATLLVFAPEIFMQMFFPLITRELSSKNLILVKELSKQITKWIFILNLPVIILVLLFPGVFINFFFGADYLFAINALRFLAVGQFIYAMGGVIPSTLLLSYGKSKLILINLIFTSIINFVLNFVLIPRYGISGAAFATSISIFILSLLAMIENYAISSIFPFRRKMIYIFLISLITSFLLYLESIFFKVNLILLIILGLLFLLTYFSLIILTKSFDKNDLLIARKIKHRFWKD